MGLISEYTKININARTAKYYERLGYDLPRKNNGKIDFNKEMIVKVNDLTHGSKTKVEIECDKCLKKYFISYSQYYKYNHKGKTYCHNCSTKIFNGGENNYKWNPNLTDEERIQGRHYQEYIDFVKRVLARDKYTCQCCGCTSNDMDVHHLNGYNWFIEGRTDETNAVTLCKNCHGNFHSLYGKGNNSKEQYEEWIGYTIGELEKYDGELPTTRKVYCIDNDTIYESAETARKELNIYSKTQIQKVCNQKQHIVEGYHFLWYDEYIKMSKQDIDEYVKKCNKSNKYTKVICLETKEVFDRIIDACLKYGTKYSNSWLVVACKEGRTCMTDKDGTPLHWMYYDEYLEAIKNNREIIIHKNTNVKSIICITHGAIFKKIKDACTQYNICKDSIIDCCKGRRKEAKKLQWMYYEDFLKLPQEEQNEILARNKDSSNDGFF